MMQSYYTLYLFLLILISFACQSQQLEDSRDERLISTFQIVRFPNDVCVGSNSKNGTCYTSAECSDKGGTSSGSCADGFGVCCTFSISTCDQTTSENMTYWTQPTTITLGASCGLTVCPTNDDICSLRLDFTTFVITGPSTKTNSQVRRYFNEPIAAANAGDQVTMGSTFQTNCLVDTFTAQGASPSSSPPVICGTNSKTHMYVEADVNRCNHLSFSLGDGKAAAIDQTNTRGITTLQAQTWDITITQLECSHPVLPPAGCTQYFFGVTTGVTIQSYNYFATVGTSTHLGNQHQRICIRRERGYCIGCFIAAAASDLNLSGLPATQALYSYPGGCCGYASSLNMDGDATADVDNAGLASASATTFGYDCVIIPGAFQNVDSDGDVETTQTTTTIKQVLSAGDTIGNTPAPPQLCGNGAGIGTGVSMLGASTSATNVTFDDQNGDTNNLSVCTRNVPFTLEFMSDDIEGMGITLNNSEAMDADLGINNGFKLVVNQIAC